MKTKLWSMLCVLMVVSLLFVNGCTPKTEPAAASADSGSTQVEQPAAASGTDGDKVVIRWFVGLGAGSEPENIPAQEALVEAFNASHDNIELVVEFVDYEQAPDVLSTQIAGGNPPDIVGPVGWSGVNPFDGLWLDMAPYLNEANMKWEDFSEAAIASYRLEDGMVGIPFAVYPAAIFYNRDLFDEAGLEYPPHSWGADYADGKPWDVAKLEELAKVLTVDANGLDANADGFDPENIVQFGYHTIWSDGPKTDLATLFGAGNVVDADGNAYFSEVWREGINWYYSGMHEKHFIPNSTYELSDLLSNDNTFDSGNLAMTGSHLWYTCCVESIPNWDVAAIPSYNGKLTSKVNADTFRVFASTKHPEEAMEVVVWMTGEAASDLLKIYGGMPARKSLQDSFFADLDKTFTQGVDWQVFIDGMNYPDVPNSEANMPNYSKAFDRLGAFRTLYAAESNLDINAELDKLITDLQSIFDEVK